MSSFRTVRDRVGPLVLIVVITVQYNYRVWKLYYTTLTDKWRHQKEDFGRLGLD